MFTNIDDITIHYEEDGIEVVKELDKEVLSRGAWTTILFRYREWDRKIEDYGPDKFTIRRYRKVRDEFRQQSKFNISNVAQARKIRDTLDHWIREADEGQE